MGLNTWLRRRRLPAGLRPALAGNERVVAWAPVGDGALVATNLGLWLPAAEPPQPRCGWHTINKVTWSSPLLTLTTAAEVPADGPDTETRYTVGADLPPVAFRLAAPGQLPEQVRQRVNRSVAFTTQHQLPGGGAVRVVARRVSGVDGLTWVVRYQDGADPADPTVAAVTAELVDLAATGLATPL